MYGLTECIINKQTNKQTNKQCSRQLSDDCTSHAEGAILTFPATHIWLDDATVQTDKLSVGIHKCEPCCGTNELPSSLP